MASITARRSVLRGRPPALGGGRRGAITAHSRSVMSLGYRADMRLWSWRVVSSQAISSSASQPSGDSQPTDITQLLFGPALREAGTGESYSAWRWGRLYVHCDTDISTTQAGLFHGAGF